MLGLTEADTMSPPAAYRASSKLPRLPLRFKHAVLMPSSPATTRRRLRLVAEGASIERSKSNMVLTVAKLMPNMPTFQIRKAFTLWGARGWFNTVVHK